MNKVIVLNYMDVSVLRALLNGHHPYITEHDLTASKRRILKQLDAPAVDDEHKRKIIDAAGDLFVDKPTENSLP